MEVRWISQDNQYWYEGCIALPEAISYKMDSLAQINNSNPKLVVNITNWNNIENFVYGDIILENIEKTEVLMKFRLSKLNNSTREFYLSKYSIPKDFVFPKWEGREALTFPEIDF